MFDGLIDSFLQWVTDALVNGILSALSGVFDSLNEQIGQIAANVSMTPQTFSPDIYSMIQKIANLVVLPIGMAIMAGAAGIELIELVKSHNRAQGDGDWTKKLIVWVLKLLASFLFIQYSFPLIMLFFDLAKWVVNGASGIIGSSSAGAISGFDLAGLETVLRQMNHGQLALVLILSWIVRIFLWIGSIVILMVVWIRMLEIYITASMGAIPISLILNRQQGHVGAGYLRLLGALALQGLAIIICVAIYTALVNRLVLDPADIIDSLWWCMAYGVLLFFMLLKTGQITRSVLGAH